MTLRLILAEDEPGILAGLEALDWAALGCELAGSASDGQAALRLVEDKEADILLSDIRMPLMSGLDLADEIARRKLPTQVILLTAYPDFDYARQALRSNVADYIVKPLNMEQLEQALSQVRSRILEDARLESAREAAEKQQLVNLKLNQEIFLNKLLYNSHLSTLQALYEASGLGIQLREYVVMELRTTRYRPLTATQTVQAFQVHENELETAIEKISSCFGDQEYYVLPRAEDYAFIVVSVSGQPLDLLVPRLNERLEDLNFHLSAQVSLAVSSSAKDLQQMNHLARQADQALAYSTNLSSSDLVRYEDVMELSPDLSSRTDRALTTIHDALRERQKDTAGQAIRELFTSSVDGEALTHVELHSLYEVIRNMLQLYAHDHVITDPALQARLASQPRSAALSPATAMDDLISLVDNILDSDESTDPSRQVLDRLCRYLADNLSGDLNLNDLARRVHLSPSYLSKTFKMHTGVNLTRYIQNLRIEQAMKLLRDTDLLNYQVGEAVGLSDPVYFAKLFKRLTGISPSEYRRSFAGKN